MADTAKDIVGIVKKECVGLFFEGLGNGRPNPNFGFGKFGYELFALCEPSVNYPKIGWRYWSLPDSFKRLVKSEDRPEVDSVDVFHFSLDMVRLERLVHEYSKNVPLIPIPKSAGFRLSPLLKEPVSYLAEFSERFNVPSCMRIGLWSYFLLLGNQPTMGGVMEHLKENPGNVFSFAKALVGPRNSGVVDEDKARKRFVRIYDLTTKPHEETAYRLKA